MTGLDGLAMLAGTAPVEAIGPAAFGASVVLDRRAVSEHPQPEGVHGFRNAANEREHGPRIAHWSQS